ncbi:hypothetical protein CVULP_0808 [Campylobacter vulpis]|nr:hypothetical protein CVULP_0808 [Campylobacter vulpis]
MSYFSLKIEPIISKFCCLIKASLKALVSFLASFNSCLNSSLCSLKWRVKNFITKKEAVAVRAVPKNKPLKKSALVSKVTKAVKISIFNPFFKNAIITKKELIK